MTNDDGVTAPGLLALAQEIQNLGQVSILAPDRNWSAIIHVKSINRPLRVRKVFLENHTTAYASDGAPSDCVALGLLGYFGVTFDLVVSGINPLPNFGHDVTYSGTVTAAMEAIINGVPGIALSLRLEKIHPDVIDYQRPDPRGNDYYWISGDAPSGIPQDGPDIGALAAGYVSTTPLQLDLTAYPAQMP